MAASLPLLAPYVDHHVIGFVPRCLVSYHHTTLICRILAPHSVPVFLKFRRLQVIPINQVSVILQVAVSDGGLFLTMI